MTIQMKALEQYFHEVLLVFENFANPCIPATWRIFLIFNLAFLGVKGLNGSSVTSQFLTSSLRLLSQLVH